MSLRIMVLFTVAVSAAPHAVAQQIRYDAARSNVPLVFADDVSGDVRSTFSFRARGEEEVSRAFANASGVLFQGVASAPRGVNAAKWRLNVERDSERAARLILLADQEKYSSPSPAWVWVVAAKFAAHRATGAITMVDDPETPGEKQFARRWNSQSANRGGRLMWARYHPAIHNQLVGFFLFAADGMLADPVRVRTITDGVVGLEQNCCFTLSFDRTRSRRAAGAVAEMIALEAEPGDFAMLNDLHAKQTIQLTSQVLRLTGEPTYQFARRNARRQFEPIGPLNRFVKSNRGTVRDVNPAVAAVVRDFCRHVAFFNLVQRQAPDEFARFNASLDKIESRLPRLESPVALPLSAQ